MERDRDNHQNLSTIAIFLSSVTASMLQYSTDLAPKTSSLSYLVNSLWFISLVTSISSAIGSWLAFSWNSAPFQTPPQHTPFLINMIMRQLPLVLLGTACVLLLLGVPLYLFAFFASTNLVVPVLVTVIVALLFTSLLLAVCWEIGEEWAAHSHAFPRLNEHEVDTWFQLFCKKLFDVRIKIITYTPD